MCGVSSSYWCVFVNINLVFLIVSRDFMIMCLVSTKNDRGKRVERCVIT